MLNAVLRLIFLHLILYIIYYIFYNIIDSLVLPDTLINILKRFFTNASKIECIERLISIPRNNSASKKQ